MGGNYGYNDSSRGSSPSYGSSQSYLEPMPLQPKGSKQSYDSQGYLKPRSTNLGEPRPSSSSSRYSSSSNSTSSSSQKQSRSSNLKPTSIDYPDRKTDDRVSDKRDDRRYYSQSTLYSSRDANMPSSSRKDMDSRYYQNSSYYR